MRAADLCFAACLVAAPALAADPGMGRMLYENHCGTCHYERIHDRKKTEIDTLTALKVEIARRAAQTDRRFTPAELDDIAEYLNQSHYRLAK